MAMLPIAAFLGLVALAPAPVRFAPAPAPAVEQDEELRPAARVLVLVDGSVLRVRAQRRHDGVWEVARDGSWIALGTDSVVSWRLESDVLADLRANLRRLDREGPVPAHQRLEVARWCERNGLLVEALEQVDAALEDFPGDRVVERFLERLGERLRFDFGLPEVEALSSADDRERERAVESALRTISRLGPSGRYLASAELVRDAGWERVAPAVDEDLRRAGPLGRRLAAELAGRFGPGPRTKVLLVRAVLDSDEGVRVASAVALGRADEPALLLPVERALTSRSSQVRANAAVALGHMGYQQALPAIASALLAPPGGGGPSPRAHVFVGRQVAYVQDFDVEVATAASVADPQIGVLVEGSVLDARVVGTSIERTVVRRHLVGAAERLSGRDLGDDPDQWEAWARGYLAEQEPAGPTTPGGAD